MPSRSPSGSGSATGILDPPFSRIVVNINNSSGRTDPLGALEGLAWLAEFPGSENSHANTDAPSGSRALRRSPFRTLPDILAVISQRYAHPMLALAENAFSRFEAYNATKTAELGTERGQ